MANLKEIRSRISSVGSTMQITSAMKMVSAAKLKRAQDAVTQMRPYANKLTELLVNLSSTLDSSEGGVYSQNRETKKILLVTITSNRGLCGGFNANIIKKVKSLTDGEYKGIKTDVISIGKKSTEYFEKNGYNVISSHDVLYADLTLCLI
jgi:F-type H+-transporting ATPase subunit gamma